MVTKTVYVIIAPSAPTVPADTPECERHAGRLPSICDLWYMLFLWIGQLSLRCVRCVGSFENHPGPHNGDTL